MSNARRIIVINPNSTPEVTSAMRDALDDRFLCLDIPEGPATIVTDRDVAEAGPRVAALAAAQEAPLAVIVACFSDPGVAETRAAVPCPVIGIQEAGVAAALALAPRFGIIALSELPIARHRVRLERMGMLERLADEVGLSGVSAYAAGHDPAVYDELLAAGRRLIASGAGAIVLGCGGFGPRRAVLQAALGVPIVDPVLAAAGVALSVTGGQR
ncbi:aspartate/glutamate racemase family protein [Roseisalinus antarcticus]|uniref:Asp/Glu/Hydantoin racemase n=1 Tax=Roseisalinus antarcticus TaxID=254357 RepID=A0A1Y5T5A9_9RHOB|nr:aspartate/glutamate racemase family protein [Roseisalinus antarcticus]SLN56276.1 Asp/Glu/Hydantoin racemase [Roseisalinus antarcticus]